MQPRVIALIVFVLVSLSTITYLLWPKGSSAPAENHPMALMPLTISHLPFYGSIEKTPLEQQQDRAFIAGVLAKEPNEAHAAYYYLAQANDALQKKEYNKAMEQANLAWLLDHEHFAVYYIMAQIQEARYASPQELNTLWSWTSQFDRLKDPEIAKSVAAFKNSLSKPRDEKTQTLQAAYEASAKAVIDQYVSMATNVPAIPAPKPH